MLAGMISILGENYEEVSGDGAVLWRGDLLLFDQTCGEDCKAYMVCISSDGDSFNLVNYVGYKAGAYLAATIPSDASEPDALNIRLSWLRENWRDVIPIGVFETTKFYTWKP